MIRLFVALAFPAPVVASLAGLCGGVPGARWTEPHNLHLTLRFIGEVSEAELPDIDDALAELEAREFSLVLAGVGCFGQGHKARALWAGIEPSQPLVRLQGRIESALTQAGLAPDPRKFTPHITLARLKQANAERLGQFLETRNLFRAGPVAVTDFALFESRLTRSGPDYTLLRRYPLMYGESDLG